MISVHITHIINNKQTNERIIKTKDKHRALLCFEGTVMGVRYKLKDKEIEEVSKHNKVVFKYNDNRVIISLKED